MVLERQEWWVVHRAGRGKCPYSPKVRCAVEPAGVGQEAYLHQSMQNKKIKPEPQGSPSGNAIFEAQLSPGKAESCSDSPRYKCLQLTRSTSPGLDICKVPCLP